VFACARHLASFSYPLGCFLTTLNLHVQIPELGDSSRCWSVARRRRELLVDRSELFPFNPSWSTLEILGCSLWALVTLFILVYLLVIHYFAPLGDVIFCNIESHSVITVYLYYFIGMYIIIMLSYSNSYMYWCLVYICEGISALRIYVAVTFPYRGIGALQSSCGLGFKT